MGGGLPEPAMEGGGSRAGRRAWTSRHDPSQVVGYVPPLSNLTVASRTGPKARQDVKKDPAETAQRELDGGRPEWKGLWLEA